MSAAWPIALYENNSGSGKDALALSRANGNVAKVAPISSSAASFVETHFDEHGAGSLDDESVDPRRKHLISPIKRENSLRNCLLEFVTSRKFLVLLIVLLAIFAIVCFVLLLIVSARNDKLAEDADFLNRNTDWRNTCEKKCKMNFDVPPLLLISMDGFRADYFQHDLTPAVSRILDCGTRAPFMIPSYPSKTFPNHYTIVTGLYPESHGIVDNMFMDPSIENKFFSKRTNDSRWYGGEPIWNTASKNNRKSATFFWPGSEVPIQGLQPTYLYLYDKSTPFSKRVDQVISWLELGNADMPYFLAMYFEQPDAACHTEGPDSDLVKSGLIYVDAMINYLMYRLDRKGLLGCLNIVIVSDHGGQAMHPEKFMAVGDHVDVTDGNMQVFPGAVGHLNFNNLSNVNISKVVEPFSCRLNHSFRVYTKRTIPRRYHYVQSRRIGPVMFDGYLGARLFKSQKELTAFKDRGDHGYDNRNREMHAIFGAYGPDIRSKTLIEPFQNIELYNLFTDLMRLPFTANTNGTRGVLYPVLKSPPAYEETDIIQLQSCSDVKMLKCGDGCYFKLSLFNGTEEFKNSSITKKPIPGSLQPKLLDSTEKRASTMPDVSNCQRLTRLEAPRRLVEELELCELEYCNASMAYSRREERAYFVESVLSLPVANIDHRANCSAILWFKPKVTSNNKNVLAPTVSMESAAFPSAAPWTKIMPDQVIMNLKNTVSNDAQKRTVRHENSTSIPLRNNENFDNNKNFINDSILAVNPSDSTISDTPIVKDPLNLNGEAGYSRLKRSDANTATLAAQNQGTNNDKILLVSAPTEPSFVVPTATQQKSATNLGNGTVPPQEEMVCKNVKWNSSPWISLFPDNDYTRYVFQGQIRVPLGFYNGPWKHLLDLILKYQRHYKKLLMYTGPIFDHNNDGIADEYKSLVTPNNGLQSDKISKVQTTTVRQPSHVYVILIRCSNAKWREDYRACQDTSDTSTLAFILPLVEKDDNCLFLEEYLFLNTARIRDVELLTNFEWFTNRKIYKPSTALHLRTQLSQQLWQLERHL